MRIACIVNLLAGRGRAAKMWPKIEPILKQRHVFQVYFTGSPGDAVNLAAKAQAQGAEILVAVGGDGTINEVVNGMDLQRGILGILPVGTGNDLCKSLEYPNDPLEVAEHLLSWHPRQIDLGISDRGYFTNVIGAGFDGQVAHDINFKIKYLHGKAAYLAGILKNLITYRNTPLELEYDGLRWEGKALLIAVGNGGYYGGGFQIVPPAVVDDGYFHICLAKDVGKLETLRILPKVYRGGHIGHRDIEIFKARRVKIKSTVPLTVQADGEIIGILPLTLELIPRALNILSPPPSPSLCAAPISLDIANCSS